MSNKNDTHNNNSQKSGENLNMLISNIHQNITPKSSSRTFGKPLFFEHLPNIKFRHSNEGVLFTLFENGEAFFYPLNEQTKGNQPTSAKMLTQEPSRKKSDIGNLSSKQQETNKFFVYDVSLSLNADLYRVSNFNLKILENFPPKKILLSPNKNLLLVLGAEYKGNSSLLVYQIIEDGVPDFFKLIFHDFSFTFIDVCFSPDSKSLIVIPSRFPPFIFILSLPLFYKNSFQNNPSYIYSNITIEELKVILQKQKEREREGNLLFERNISNEEMEKLIGYEARKAGPLSIIGPAKGIFGQTLKMTHIAANPNLEKSNSENQFHFVTWNDDPLGEYCLWELAEDEILNEKTPKFKYFPKTVVYRQTEDDYDWSPKCWILDMKFSNREAKLSAIVKREYKSRKSENGIGIQMMNLLEPDGPSNRDIFWYQVTDSLDTSKILCFKWTNTLFIGTSHAASIMIEGKGIFEMVDYRFTSSFQDLYETFVNEGCNFIQVERHNRFWLNKSGVLRVMVVTPQKTSFQLEWNEIEKASKTDILNMRVLGKRIGYYINTLEKDNLDYFKKRGKEKLPEIVNNGQGETEKFCGLHLHKCWNCRRLLLKPLQCSRCKTVVYCSKGCQKTHWISSHRHECKMN